MSPKSTIGIKTPSPKNTFHKNVDEWLNDKRSTDGAEGLWRVHDDLYDLTNFIRMHPGGQFWLEETQGMDITEAFEAHHISTIPEDLLRGYYVRPAQSARASPFTFNEDGFYKTLKKKARAVLKDLPPKKRVSSNNFTDGLLFAMFAFAIAANTLWSYPFAVVSGVLFAATIIASHNYSHQRDNFRMYYGDLCMEDSRSWRIVHVLSHHLFTNTIADLQAYGLEPLIMMYPEKKSSLVRYGSIMYAPLLLWPTMFFLASIGKASKLILFWRAKKLSLTDLLPFVLPFTMYLLSDQSLFHTIIMWEIIISIGGFIFAAVAFTSSHFHPEIFIDGDQARSAKDLDWGINQLDCVADRSEVTGNRFLVLVAFGDHAIHHLFPTLDHGVLQHLYPVVQETMKEFGVDLRMKTTTDMLTGYFRQVAREKPNPNPPGFKM